MKTLRVTAALKYLFQAQIECRTDPNESPGITVYAKLGTGPGVVELDDDEVHELLEEFNFWLMPEQEKYPGEVTCVRAAMKQLKTEAVR